VSTENTDLLVSVVVPTYYAGGDLDKYLGAVAKSDWPNVEILVADDASTDETAREIAERHGATYIRLEQNSGPAIARNIGAREARGDIIMLMDADVMFHPDAISRAVDVLSREPEVGAIFGSYDDSPTHPAFLSQYRNLYHHWNHQMGNTEASTFWTGCGAVKREAFEAVSGFSLDFPKPGMEDIEFGYRLKESGYRILLVKDMQCTHLKDWPLTRMIYTDIFQRGVPWMSLMLQYRDRSHNLNTDYPARIATLAAGILGLSLVIAPFYPLALWVVLLMTLVIVLSQWGFYKLTARIRGWGFTLGVVPAQVIFFFCCAVSIPLGIFHYLKHLHD